MTKRPKLEAVTLEDGELRPLAKCRTETLVQASSRTAAAGSVEIARAIEAELTRRKVKWRS